MISKIKIKEYGILKDTELECKKFNLIFGYNGSGKTTLTRIFKEISENNINSDKYTIEYPDNEDLYIKVYSGKDYLNDNFRQNVNPISFNLGEESIKLKDELEKINNSINNMDKKIAELDTIIAENDKNINAKYQSIAKNIVSDCDNNLQTQKCNINTVKKVSESKSFEKIDNSKLLDYIHELKNINNRVDIKEIDNIDINKHINIYNDLLNILNKSIPKLNYDNNIFKDFISKFENGLDQNFKNWILEGIKIDTFQEKKCPFCFRPLGELYDNFTKYFNDEINKIINSLKLYEKEIINLKEYIFKLNSLIDEKSFYIEEQENIINLKNSIIEEYNNIEFDSIFEDINKKISNIYIANDDIIFDYTKNLYNISEKINNINLKIKKHNETIKNNDGLRKNIIDIIISHYLAIDEEYINNLKLQIEESENNKKEIFKQKSQIIDRKEEIEKKINDIKIPLEKLNSKLHNFLGRKDIRIEFDDMLKEYKIMREKDDIKNYISEGEKTAICIVHFIISLEDNKNNKNKQNCIVVIDDPISSLDSNYLYNLYSFLHANLQDVEQLFIITHHFYFFRRVYNWFSNNRNKDYTREKYSIKEIKRENSKFLSQIYDINEYFKNYESEYQYLYSELQKFKDLIKNKERLEYEKIILLPNMCRRIFESILSFLDPFNKHDSRVFELLNSISSDVNVKEKLLYIYRYTNTESHHQAFDLYDTYQKNPDEAIKLIDAMFTIIDEISENQLNSYNRHLNKQNKN